LQEIFNKSNDLLLYGRIYAIKFVYAFSILLLILSLESDKSEDLFSFTSFRKGDEILIQFYQNPIYVGTFSL